MEDVNLFDTQKHPHMRQNYLTGEWVIVSPHRTQRPWQGNIEATEDEVIPRHSKNPLCPGSTRSSGKVTGNYTSTYTFENDFPTLLEETPEPPKTSNEFFQCRKATGRCFVTCFHPYSDLSLPLMSHKELIAVIKEWKNQFIKLSTQHKWVQIFENKGKMMGCSNAHPHCQIYASDFLPAEAVKEDSQQKNYFERKNSCMLIDYMKSEVDISERIVTENEQWVVLVPFWALWPFEILVIPKIHTKRFSDLTEDQENKLAEIMKIYLTKYDNLFHTSFPYSMGWHSAPTGPNIDKSSFEHWQLHAHYYPPLLRSATVKKHLVGYEMLGNVTRDISPEKAAALLKDCSDIHYKVAK